MVIEHLEHDTTGTRIRVRVSTWLQDVFEILSYEEFNTFKTIGEKLGIIFRDLDCEGIAGETQ